MAIQPGQTLLHYRLVEKIGKGGMGEVYAAEDTKLHRRVALKVLPQEMAADPDRRARFEREARAVAALSHPNIVTLHSVEEADSVHFMTMELVEGKTLAEMLPRTGFTLSQLLEIAIPLADAVSRAHREGITHRDLKPDNIMIDVEGRLRVLDFGLAKLHDPWGFEGEQEAETATAGTGEGKILGTVAYMSPEQAEGKTGRSALGRLLAGHDPLRDGHGGTTLPWRHEHVHDRIDPQGRAGLGHRAQPVAAAPRWVASSAAAWPRTRTAATRRRSTCATSWRS